MKLLEIITIKKYEHNLEDFYVSESTVISRIRRRNTNNVCRELASPMAKVEPTLCHLLKYAARMGQGVSQQNIIYMANELIQERVIGAEVAAWKLQFNLATLEKFKGNRIQPIRKSWLGMVVRVSKTIQGDYFLVCP